MSKKMKLLIFIPITYKGTNISSFNNGETFIARSSINGQGIKFIHSETNIAFYSFVDVLNDRYLSICSEIYKTFNNSDVLVINSMDFRNFSFLEEGSIWRPMEMDSGFTMFREFYLSSEEIGKYIKYLVYHLNSNRNTDEENYMLGRMVKFNGGDFKFAGNKLEVRFFPEESVGLTGLTSTFIQGNQEKEYFIHGYYSLESIIDENTKVYNIDNTTYIKNFNLNNLIKSQGNSSFVFDGKIDYNEQNYEIQEQSHNGFVVNVQGLLYVSNKDDELK